MAEQFDDETLQAMGAFGDLMNPTQQMANENNLREQIAELKAERDGLLTSQELRQVVIDKVTTAGIARDNRIDALTAKSKADQERIAELIELLSNVDVVMDGAAEQGVEGILAPAYREDWARIHQRVQAQLKGGE